MIVIMLTRYLFRSEVFLCLYLLNCFVFLGAKPLQVLNLGEGISFFRAHEESSLIGIILENFVISLVDIEAQRVVRKLSGHTGQITDACFSPDARWIITASMDSTVRTWDIPTASLIDIFKVIAIFFFFF